MKHFLSFESSALINIYLLNDITVSKPTRRDSIKFCGHFGDCRLCCSCIVLPYSVRVSLIFSPDDMKGLEIRKSTGAGENGEK